MKVPRLGVESELQPQQRQIWALSATYTTAPSTTRSLTHWSRPGIEPASSLILIGFVTAEPQGNSNIISLTTCLWACMCARVCTHTHTLCVRDWHSVLLSSSGFEPVISYMTWWVSNLRPNSLMWKLLKRKKGKRRRGAPCSHRLSWELNDT